MFTSHSRSPAPAILCLCLLLCTSMPPARAEIESAAENGFVLRLEVPIMASPTEVYAALTERVAQWWHPAHTFSGDASSLTIEAQAQGCFCEKLKNGGSVRHMEVVFAAPGKLLRMEGGLGPLQSLGAGGSLGWQLHQEEGGTRVEVRYSVSGYLADGLDAWAKPVESVLSEQLSRLKNLIETGQPELPEEVSGDEQ